MESNTIIGLTFVFTISNEEGKHDNRLRPHSGR